MNTKSSDFNANMEKFIDYLRSQNSRWNKIPERYYDANNVKRGLRNADGTGVLAGLTSIGEVHGYVMDEGNKMPVEGRLRYRGINIEDIVDGCRKEKRFGFEETAFLLLFGFLPSRTLLERFEQNLADFRMLPPEFTEDMILKAPSKNVMNKLARSVLALYSYDDNPDDISVPNLLRQSLMLIARFPMLIAHSYASKRHYYDNRSLILHNPVPKYNTAQNFLHMIRPDNSFTPLEAEILDLTLLLQAEHGGGNNSAFAVHVLSSTGTDTYSVISAALGSLKGPRHGGANEKMCSQMDEIKNNVKNWEDKDEIYEYLKKIMLKEAGDGKGLIYGMGHAVYTLSDPRAVILKERARELASVTGHMDEFNLYDSVEEMAPIAFKDVKGTDKPICANIDFYSGFVYQMLQIPRELFTPIFAMARIVGWCAHRIEEVVVGRRIIRPAYKSAVKRLEYISIDDRSDPSPEEIEKTALDDGINIKINKEKN